MNQRLWRIVCKTTFLSLIGVGFVVGEVWGQASVTQIRHETLSQRETDITFNQGVSFSGAPTTTGWTVTINGTSVGITSIGTFGPNTVRIQFNANTIAGHSASETFLKPGELLRVSYNGTGNLTSSGGVTTFTNTQSLNNFVFTCAEMIFFKQEVYSGVDVCSPVVMNFTQYVYKASLRYRNSSTFSLGNIFYNIQWGDAAVQNSSPYISDLTGAASASFIDNTGFTGSNPAIVLTSRPTHNYPAANPTDCSFNFQLTPFVNGVASCPSISTTTLFATYDTDNANSGSLSMPPSVVGSNLVCLGDNVGMRFSDATQLNCRAAIEPIVPNEGARNIRIVYGSTNFGGPGNIPDIRVTLPAILGGGTTQVTNNNSTGTLISGAFTPASVGVADFNGVITLAAPVTAATATAYMGTIFTTLTNNQAVGQRFYVRLDYWDVCNPYNAGSPTSPAPVSIENFVQIINSPNPPGVNNPIVCETAGTGSFNITATGVGAGTLTYTWYKDAALSIVLQGPSTTNTFNPVTQGPAIHRINPAVSGSTVFNRYVTVTQGSNNCTSQPQTITIQIDDTNTPGSISHPLGASPITICSGDDPVSFVNASSGTGGGPGGSFTYQWQQASASGGPYSDIGGAVAATFDPTFAQVNAGRFFRRRVRSGACGDVFSNIIEFRIDTPVTGGSIGNAQTICTGGNPGIITNTGSPTGGNGSYSYLWQESTALAGPYNPASGTNNLITYDPPVLATTMFYRRFVSSGVCSPGTALSNVIEITVDQVVVAGVVNNPQTICAGQNPAILGETTPPSGGNGSTYTILWEQSATGGGVGFVAAAGINNTATYDPPVLASTTFYRRRISSGVCADAFSNEIQITVNALPTANVTGGGSACSGTPAADLVWTLTGATNFNFTITASTAEPGFPLNVVGHSSTTFTIIAPNPAATTTYTMIALSDGNGCSGSSLGGGITVTVQATPPPSVEAFTAQAPVCDDGAGTNPPDAILDLLPNSVQNYAITYRLRRVSTATFLPGSINFAGASDAAGVVNLAPTYAQFGAVPNDPLGYQVVITAIQNTTTLCAGAVPINGPTLIINPRPPTPTGAVPAIACQTAATGAPISVTAPPVGFTIVWSTTAAPTFTAAAGATGGTRGNTFTPTSNATVTYHAFTRDNIAPTNCLSASSLSVQHTQDLQPAIAAAGADQPNLCSGNATFASTAATNGGSGTWTVLGQVAYMQNFENATQYPIGTTTSSSGNGWTIDTSAPNAFPQQSGGGIFSVQVGKRFLASNTNGNLGGGVGNIGEVVWSSSVIDVSSLTSVSASVDLINASPGQNEAVEDYIRVLYRLNGGGEIQFPTNGFRDGDFANTTASVSGLVGATFQIVVRVSNTAASEFIGFDNILVRQTGSTVTISDPNAANATVSGLPQNPPGGAPINYTARWTVASALGVCPSTADDVILTVNAIPAVFNQTPQVCEDTAGGGVHAGFNLTTLDAALTGGAAGVTVEWFAGPGLTNPIIPPTAPQNISNGAGGDFFVRLSTPIPCVNNTGTVTFTVNTLPAANNPSLASRTFCEDVQGGGSHAGVNLAAYNGVINGTATITWFPTLADAQAVTNQILPGVGAGQVGNFTLFNGVPVTARVVDGNNCANFREVFPVINPLPADNLITGNDVDCSSATAVKVYQANAALNAFGTTHVYNWTVNGAGTNFEVFDGSVFVTTNNYSVTQNSFLLLVRFPNPGTFTFTVSETIDGCTGNTVNKVVNVSGAPPALAFNAPQTQVCKGQSGVTYSLTTAPQAGSNYVWTVVGGSVVGPSSGNITSITVNWGTLTAPQPSVSVTESNASGCAGAPVSVNVFLNNNPVMVSPNSATICSGATPSSQLTFNATLGGGPPISPITFNWSVVSVPANVTGVTNGQTGNGQLTMPLTNVSGVDGIVTFEVTPVENDLPNPPNCTAPPQTVFITVKPQPIINPGQAKLICPGTSVNYSILVTPALLPATTTFSWAAPTMSAGGPQGAAQPGIAIGAAGTLHITDNLTNSTNAVITATYNVVPTNGTCVYPSVPVVISIEPIPTMVANLTSLSTQCSGDNVNINLTSPTVPNTPTDIKWDVAVTKTTGTGVAGGTAFTNLSNQAFPSVVNGTLTNSGNDPITVRFVFTPKLQGSSNCAGTPLAPIDVVVEPQPMMTRTLTTPTTICNNGTVTFDLSTVTTPSNAGDIKWDVAVSKSAGTGVAGGTAFANLTNQSTFGVAALTGTLTNSGNDAITVQFVFTPKLQGTSNCAGTPLAAVNVVVEPTPTMTRTLTTASTICNGGTVNFDLSSLTTPSVAGDIKWDVTVTKTAGTGAAGGTAFASLTNQSSFTAGALNGTLTNSGNDPITVRFVFTPRLQGTSNCAGTPLAPVDVVVEPSPSMTRTLTTPTTICNGGSVSFDLTTVTTPSVPTDIKWDVTVSKSAGTGAAGGTAFANLTNQSTFGVAALSGTLTNSGNDAITIQFVFTPKLQGSSNCAGTPLAAVNVVVEPTPTMTRTLTTASTICNSGSVNFDLATLTSPSVAGDIKWDVAVTKTAGTGAAGGTAFANLTNQSSFIASALNGTLTNSGNDPITVRFVFTPKLQGTSNCAGTPLAPVDVVVEPAPLMTRTLTTASTICNGDLVNFNLATVTTPSVASDIKWDVTVTQVSGAGVLSGTAFANLTNQTFTAGVATLNGTLINSGGNAATARFVFTPKLQGTSNCAGVALAAVDVVVEPTPVMTRTLITPSTVCNNGTVTFNLSTTTSPSVAADIKWDVLITQTLGSGAVGGTGFTSLNNQAFTAGAAVFSGNLTNSGNDPATVRYIFTPKLQGSSNCPAASLAPVDIVVEPVPMMTRTLTTPTTICNNGTVNFDLATVTTPSTAGDIKWDLVVSKISGAGAAGGSAFTNLTNQSSFTAGAVNGLLTNSGNDPIVVRFVFTPKLQGSSNCAGTALAPIDVTVEPVPMMTRTLTTPSIICDGGNVSFTLGTSTTPSTVGDIKWDVAVTQIGGTGIAAGSAFANLSNQAFIAGTASLSGTLTNNGNNVATVRFVFTPKLQGSSNCSGTALAPIDVQVEPTPIAVIGNSTPTVCNNGNVNILISSPTSSTTPADLKFDLTVASTNPGATGGTAFAALANQSFPVLIGGTLTNSSDNFITVTYTVTPKLQGSSNCPGVVPPSFNVVVEPTPKVTASNNQPRLCNGGTPDIGITSVTNPSIPGNLTFDIIPTLPPGVTGTGNAASGVFSVSAPFALNTGTLSNSTNISQTVVYTITPKLSGCVNGASQTVNVIVEPTPQVSLTNNLPKICNGGTPNITVTSPTSPSLATDLTFDVVVTLPGGVTGTGIAANGVVGASAPFSINAGTITNSNNTFQTITYTVTPKLNLCANGPVQVVNVIVEPTPVATPTNNLPVICNGGTPDITITSPTVPSVAGNLTFDVSVSLPAGVSGTGVAGSGTSGASAPFSVNTGTLTNSTSSFRTVVYTITPKLSGCANGTPQIVNVIVEPTPAAAFVNNSPTICTGSSPSIDITSPTSPSVPGNLTFDVAVSLPAGVTGTGIAGSGVLGAVAPFSINTGTLTHDNLSNANLVVTYTITPKLAGCANGTPQIVNVTVRPIPVGAFDNSRIVCSDEAFTYNIQTANIDGLGNQVNSLFTYTVSSSDEANVPTPIGLDRTVASNAPINGNFNNANLAGADVDITYTITPFNASGSCAGAPFDVVVRVRPEPTAPALTTVDHCSDAVNPFVFDLQTIVDTGVGGNSVPSNFSYTVSSTNPLAVFPESNKPVADATPISHIYSNFSSNDVTITYVVTPFSQVGNCQGTNFQFKIVVHPEPVGSNVVDPVCSTTLNYNIQSQITNGLPSIFTYTVSSDNVGVPAGSNRVVASNAPITDTYTNSTGLPANVTYTITPFNAANPTCAGTPFTYRVNVSPNPTGVSDTKAAKCSDVPFVEDPQNNIVPAVASTFTWTATYDFGLTGGLGSGTGVIAETLHNETAGQLFAHYTVIPTAGTCVGAAFFIDIPIDAEPVMLPGLSNPPAVCSTNAVSTNPIGVILQTNGVSVAADSYIVSIKSVDAGLIPSGGNQALPNTFTANSPSAGQSDAINNDTYRNTTSAQLKVVYTVIPVSADGCQGNAFDITVPINPEPVLTTPVWPDVCSSNTGVSNPVNIVLGTNGTSANAVSYQLLDRQYSNGGPFGPGLPTAFTPDAGNAVIMAAPGSINLIKNDKFNNKSTVAVTVRYTIQGFSSQGCVSEPLNYSVVVNPEPDLFVPAPGLVCSDVITGITLTQIAGSATATTFHINNIIRQAGLVAGGSNASIGLNQPNNAIFNDIFTNTTASPLTVTYKIAPVTAAGCAGAQKDIVITITPAPAVASNLNKTVCSDAPASIVLATEPSSAAAGSYRIDNITLGGVPGALIPNGAVNMSVPRMAASVNEISGDRFVNTTNSPLTVTYRITAIGSAAPFCEGPFRDVVLTVEPTIVATPNNINTSICSATPTDIELISPSLPTAGAITFNYIAVSSIGGQITGFIPALNNLPAGYHITDNLVNNSNSAATVTYTITAVANGAANSAGCSSVGVPVVVNVEPKPKLVATPLLQTVCESDGVNVSPTNILLTTTTVPSAGTMEFHVIGAPSVTGGLTLQPASLPLKTVYLNGQTIADQWNNPTLTDQTVTYTLRPVVNGGLGCPGDDVVVTVTVKPRPIITPVAPQAVCSGEFRSIPLITDIPGTFATWTVSAPPTITGALNGGGNNLDITLFNSGFNVETVTYTVTPKFNNCNGTPINIVVTVNPTPNIVGLPTSITVCNGQTLNVPLSSSVPGTTFNWTVTDVFNLETPGFFDGGGTTINQVVNNNTGFQAILIYQVTPTTPAGCVGLPKIMNVNVGSIVANVTPDRTEICSGQRIQMTNSSLGATSHRWFYRVQGTTTEIDVRTTPFVNYQLDNTTSTNPLVYEIVYQPKNGLCTVPDVVTPITVYRNVTAGFNEGTVPPIIGGTSTVNFTNTSNPVDGAQFRYEWDFGSASFANPPTFVGATPPPIIYSQQGPYQVTLKAINIAGEVAGLSCQSMFTKTIVVPVLPLVADFTLDPPAGCFPTTVKVIENKSTGDIMEWKVVDSNGGIVAVSGLDLPEFFIATPGLFTVQLTTRDSFTDQVEFANQNFEIYEVPVASFQARPATVFVPDTELTTFNFSTKSNFYQWDFGDGETSDEREPKHIYKIEGVYDVVLVAGFDHDNGVVCTDTLSQKVIAKQGGITRVPNAFTPNPAGPSGGLNGGGSGSGGAGTFNDVFLPIVKGVEEFNMQIFDRWGNLIFESNNANQGWDGYDRNGRILPAGVYVYKLTLRLSDGQRTTQIGDITMIR